MKKIIFIILSVLGISAFISCKEQKHLTTDEPSQSTTAKPSRPVTDGPSQPVTDIDGNVYKTVKLGNQVWMAENLRTTRYADGTPIPLGTEASFTTAYRYYPDDSSANVSDYGYLYNWAAVMNGSASSANVSDYGYLYNWAAVMNGSASSDANPSVVQDICPDGWHVPSDAEWTELTNYVKSQSQYVCGDYTGNIAKALASEEGWYSYYGECAVGNPDANNATGFSARPAGIYEVVCFDNYFDNYRFFGGSAYFWSATQSDNGNAYFRYLSYNDAYVDRYDTTKDYGYSVRCVRN